MKVKVCEVQSLVLDWLVAKCAGMWVLDSSSFIPHYELGRMHFSTDWAQGGPIIEREISKLFKNMGGTYTAQIRHEEHHSKVLHKVLVGYTNCAGPTPLIAAMRCYVVSKLGEEVEVPDELIVE